MPKPSPAELYCPPYYLVILIPTSISLISAAWGYIISVQRNICLLIKYPDHLSIELIVQTPAAFAVATVRTRTAMKGWVLD